MTVNEAVFTPSPDGVNWTITVHCPFGANGEEHPDATNCGSLVVTLGVPLIDIPVLVTVNDAIVELVTPTGVEPQFPIIGEIINRPGASALPLSAAATSPQPLRMIGRRGVSTTQAPSGPAPSIAIRSGATSRLVASTTPAPAARKRAAAAPASARFATLRPVRYSSSKRFGVAMSATLDDEADAMGLGHTRAPKPR